MDILNLFANLSLKSTTIIAPLFAALLWYSVDFAVSNLSLREQPLHTMVSVFALAASGSDKLRIKVESSNVAKSFTIDSV